jgi:hypothetical protein
LDACRGDEDGVVAVVGDDLLQVLGSQRLRVMAENLLRASHRCHGPPPLYRRGQPDVLISPEDTPAHKRRSLAAGYWAEKPDPTADRRRRL